MRLIRVLTASSLIAVGGLSSGCWWVGGEAPLACDVELAQVDALGDAVHNYEVGTADRAEAEAAWNEALNSYNARPDCPDFDPTTN